jgi:hypothetical protein
MTPPPDLTASPDLTAPPGRWCCRTVELAVRVLPPEHRTRYGLEFVAELYGLPPARQRRHAARVLTSAWALRAALSAAAPGTHGETAMIIKTATPLTCRLNLHHRWRWQSTEDGDRFERCQKCGKDRSDDVGGDPGVGAGFIIG